MTDKLIKLALVQIYKTFGLSVISLDTLNEYIVRLERKHLRILLCQNKHFQNLLLVQICNDLSVRFMKLFVQEADSKRHQLLQVAFLYQSYSLLVGSVVQRLSLEGELVAVHQRLNYL